MSPARLCRLPFETLPRLACRAPAAPTPRRRLLRLAFFICSPLSGRVAKCALPVASTRPPRAALGAAAAGHASLPITKWPPPSLAAPRRGRPRRRRVCDAGRFHTPRPQKG